MISLENFVSDALAAAVAEPPPLEAHVHGIGTDVEADLVPLWALTVAAAPRVVLELGTRRGVSTRTLAHACRETGAVLFTCDPDPACAAFLRGVRNVVSFRATGEELYAMGVFPPRSVDVLFVDTDPHSHAQTRGWLETWVAGSLREGGLAIFHDINARNVDGSPRPDIQVEAALKAWCVGGDLAEVVARGELSGRGWDLVELAHGGAGGLGVLRRRP